MVKIAQLTKFFKVSASVSVSRDATDDKFIALAMDAGASILISGDPDLQEVRTHRGIEILSPALFFDRFKPPSL